MKKIALTVLILFLSLVAVELPSAEYRNDLFIMDRNYGFKQLIPHPCGKSDEANAMQCRINYLRESISQMITVQIYLFENVKDASLYLDLKITRNIQGGAKPSNFENVTVNDIRYYHRLTKRADQVASISWISGKNVIIMSTGDIYIPAEMIADYQQKYPPTAQFNPLAIDPQNILKIDIQKKIDLINKSEVDRGPNTRNTNKSKEYLAMIGQCGAEMQIRCRLGMTDKDKKVECPIALMLDDSKRQAEWKNLQKEINKRQVVVENVNWDQMNKITCKHDDREMSLKMIQLLNATRKDLKDVPIELLPPEFAPDIAPK